MSWKKVLLPPLHIELGQLKLGQLKKLAKALDFEGQVFQEIRSMFTRLSVTKIKVTRSGHKGKLPAIVVIKARLI